MLANLQESERTRKRMAGPWEPSAVCPSFCSYAGARGLAGAQQEGGARVERGAAATRTAAPALVSSSVRIFNG